MKDSKEQEIIRTELNIEKWPIFSTGQDRKNSKEITRTVVTENGEKLSKKVIIGKIDDKEVGILKILDMKVFYALIKLWELAGKPINEKVYFTIYQLAEILQRKINGTTYKQIKGALERLRFTPIKWLFSWKKKGNKREYSFETGFTILSYLDIFEKKDNNQLQFNFSSFKFHEAIIQSLTENYSKPLYLDIVMKFEKEISILLYGYVDLVMADKDHFERKTKELFNDLGLTEYSRPSKRKQLLEPAIKELRGIELTTGVLSEINLEKTVDGTDYKVVFKKSKKKLKLENNKTKVIIENITQDSSLLAQLINIGITKKVANGIIKKNDAEFIKDWLKVAISKEDIEDKAAFLVQAINKKWELPTKIKRKRKETVRKEDAKLKPEYNNFIIAKVDECLKKMDAKILKAELNSYTTEFLDKFSSEIRESILKTSSTMQNIEKSFKLSKAKELNLISFDEWKDKVNH